MLKKLQEINKYMDKKTKILVISMLAIIFLIIIIAALANTMGNKYYTYVQVEDKMVAAAKSYYKEEENVASLPAIDSETIITVDTLVTVKQLKALTSLLKDGKNCSGEVKVANINGEYTYTPYLNCGEAYYSTELYNKLLTKDLVTSGDGLYQINNEYIYRGQNVNNFVSFAGELWRVVKVNEYAEISLISYKPTSRYTYVYDDRYSVERQNNSGINEFNVSRIKDTMVEYLESLNDDKEPRFSEEDKAKLVTTALCTGNRGEEVPFANGKIECNTTLENMSIGLLNLYDYAQASLDVTCTMPSDPQCQNYNYLAAIGNSGSWWLMTGNSDIPYEAYRVKSTGAVEAVTCSTKAGLRPIIILNSSVFTSGGNGTELNPYTIK